jgi:predicted NBD/HSP70 family sugar kinase
MIKDMRLFDIGGSGIKSIKMASIDDINISSVEYFTNPNFIDFGKWLNDLNLLDSEAIGISMAGFIKNKDTVKLSMIANWKDKNIVYEIQKYKPLAKIYLLNDAEAHLMAHIDMYENSIIAISLGTSLGFSMSDKYGNLMRPSDDMNYDFGAFKLNTKASNNEIWFALGSQGLQELENNMGKLKGTKHFGYRLGSFLCNLSTLFRPKTIILSGGIIDNNWEIFNGEIISEFKHQKPSWLNMPHIEKSPYEDYSALIGMYKYIMLQNNN